MKQVELLPDTAKALNELAKIKGKTPQELANEIITNYKASNTADYFNHIPFDDECEIDFCSNFVKKFIFKVVHIYISFVDNLIFYQKTGINFQ